VILGWLTWRYLMIAAALAVLVYWLCTSGVLAGVGATQAVLYMVTVDASLNVFSAQNSSPQTTELFAKDRKATLMKYVWIGDVTTLVLGAFASVIAKSLWPLAGALTVAATMHLLYVHAARKGSESGEKPPAQGAQNGLSLVGAG
jgi:hypothetical protein